MNSSGLAWAVVALLKRNPGTFALVYLTLIIKKRPPQFLRRPFNLINESLSFAHNDSVRIEADSFHHMRLGEVQKILQ